MTRLREELGVPPRAGVAVSAVLALGSSFLWAFVAGGLPGPARTALTALLGLLVFIYGFLVSYVYGDAKRRGMRPVLWALAAALVPNALGLIAYFLLREPLAKRCATCGAAARRDFAFCAQCGSPLRELCAACRRPVDASWSHCAHCGTPIAGVV
jgi:hypothetical protein